MWKLLALSNNRSSSSLIIDWRYIWLGANNAYPPPTINGLSSSYHQSKSLNNLEVPTSDLALGFHAQAPTLAPGGRNGAPAADSSRSRYK
jgi:hypothetical protein